MSRRGARRGQTQDWRGLAGFLAGQNQIKIHFSHY
jgi:hypothetical protein